MSQENPLDSPQKKDEKMPLNMEGGNRPKGNRPGQSGGSGGAHHKEGKPKNPLQWVVLFFVLTFAMNLLSMLFSSNNKIQIGYNQFVALVESGSVALVQIDAEQLLVELKADADAAKVRDILNVEEKAPGDPSVTESPRDLRVQEWQTQMQMTSIYYTGLIDDPNLTKLLLDNDVSFLKPINQTNPIIEFIGTWIMPILLMYGLFYLLSRTMAKRMGGMGGMMSVGKSKAKEYNVENETGVTFHDVAGQDEAKESLAEIVDFLHSPDKYRKIGAKQPKGALLVGPPGTGKTLLAKAVAGEAKVPFFSLSGSEFVEMFVGVGASRVRDLFEQANKRAPCIIFIDEIDAIGKSRDNQMAGSNDEREQTLNQLLAEMDGFDSGKGIVVLAATNRPEILDKALLRPGRFDRRIIVEKPDLPGREAILIVHAAKVKMDLDVNLREIALATSGATGADLANMINEGALRAVRLGRDTVCQADLMEAVEVVIAGKEKKDRIMSPKEREMVAYHEVGHALASALQKHSQPVQKITIVPRTMGSLGYTMQMPEEERYLMTRSELLAQITCLLAGRTAEELIFGESSTGASNDIERATKMARSMVTQYGMSETFDMMGLESIQSQYLDGRNVPTCSEATGAKIDEEVKSIILECHEKARALLNENRDALERIARHLIEKETITGAEFMSRLNG